MSLDYALVAVVDLPSSLSEVVEDPSFDESKYRALAVHLFPKAQWGADGTATVDCGDVFIEARTSAASLSLSLRGSGNLAAKIEEISFEALERGVITIDIQTSELLAPDLCESAPKYMAWYQSVVYGNDC